MSSRLSCRVVCLAAVALLGVVPARAQAPDDPPYVRRGHDVDVSHEAYVDRLQRYHAHLWDTLTSEAPALVPRLAPKPSPPVPSGVRAHQALARRDKPLRHLRLTCSKNGRSQPRNPGGTLLRRRLPGLSGGWCERCKATSNVKISCLSLFRRFLEAIPMPARGPLDNRRPKRDA